MRSRRIAIALLLPTLALGLTACGNKEDVVTHAGTEGIYVDVGPLKYQVQVSRLLNPEAIPEDATFISGLPGGERLARGEGWFAVFVRVQNESDDPQRLAAEIEMVDADGTVYRPVQLGDGNAFRYVASRIEGGAVLPNPDAVAGQLSINGLQLLFKVRLLALDASRPFQLRIRSATDDAEAEVELDI